MNTNDASIANEGAIVAIPCMSIPGRPTAFSRNSVLTVPSPVLPVSSATVHPFLSSVTRGPAALRSALPGDSPEIGEGHSDLRCLAAVYREDRAGHVRCVVGGQEGRSRGELFWPGQPADRHRLAEGAHLVLRHHRSEHRRRGRA